MRWCHYLQCCLQSDAVDQVESAAAAGDEDGFDGGLAEALERRWEGEGEVGGGD